VGVGQALEQVLAKYDDRDLKVVSKHLVVHPQIATEPALAACAAQQQGKFAAFEHALWPRAWTEKDGRQQLNQEALRRDALRKLAGEIGLDVKRFDADLGGQACQTQLARQRAEWRALGVNGTPGIFINGQFYAGPRTADGLSQAIDQEIAKASEALKKGVKLEDYYAQLIAGGKKSP
jgi:protein-disulfide isomerase